MRSPPRRSARRSRLASGASLGAAATGVLWILSCGDNLPPRPMGEQDMQAEMDMDMAAPFLRGAPAAGRLLGALNRPTAAVIDEKGQTVYVAAHDSDGLPAIYSAAVSGGSPQRVNAGVALGRVHGMATDGGGNLYVVDGGTDDGGAIYKGSAGGSLTSLGVTGVRSPTAIAVSADGKDLYVTGRDPADDQPALFKLPSTGGAATLALKGAPLVEPAGVTVSNDGVLYVLDAAAQAGGGAVIKVAGGAGTVVSKSALAVGFPAGISAAGASDLLITSNAPGAAAVLRMTAAGDVSKQELTGMGLSPDGDPATIYQSAQSNTWVLVDTATPPQASADALSGSILILTP